jgi:hypothetical protein
MTLSPCSGRLAELAPERAMERGFGFTTDFFGARWRCIEWP